MTVNEDIAPPDSTKSDEMPPSVTEVKHLPLWRAVREIVKISGFRYRVGVNILGLKVTALFFEGIGFAMLLPIMEYVGADRNLDVLMAQSDLWRRLVPFADGLGLPVNLATMFAVSVLCILLRQVVQYLQVSYEARQVLDLNRHVQVKGFDKGLASRLDYHDRSVKGEFVSDLTTAVSAANSSIFSVITVIGVVVQLAAYLAALVVISLWLSLFLMVSIVALGTVSRRMVRRSRSVSWEMTKINQKLMSFLVERVSSMRLVRLSGMEKTEGSNLNRLISGLNDRIYIIQMINQRISVIFEPLAFIMVFALMFVSIDILAMRVELVLMFCAVAMRTLPLMQQLVQSYQGLLAITGGMRTIIKRMDDFNSHRESDGGSLEFKSLDDSLRFENVIYDHGAGAEAPALNGVSMGIPAGKITALVGPSGSGKSTLIDLLPRLRDPDAGRITLDGIQNTEFSMKSLRSGIAFVPQRPQIFNVSAREHIQYGNFNINEAAIRKAAQLAGASDFLEALPEGYDTMLGEGGVRLSGGQLQRVDLARALARNSSVLILDEPASGLDADAEERFRHALARIREETDMTVILIAHGFSTVVDADQIIVMEQGKVIAGGTHDSLMREEGWYVQAFNKQHRAALNGTAAAKA
ncbi:MAG: ABC transporter ATP-binding protein [Alphaproteobacteria bacterium]|nr:ABC transporter ATP-binding protein [Alphaproteobacteria bacterium]